MIQPEANPEDANAVATHLRTVSDSELSQAIASPRVRYRMRRASGMLPLMSTT